MSIIRSTIPYTCSFILRLIFGVGENIWENEEFDTPNVFGSYEFDMYIQCY